MSTLSGSPGPAYPRGQRPEAASAAIDVSEHAWI
jgi:hypothetical protein